MSKLRFFAVGFVLWAMLLLAVADSRAQSTIFNIPSTDVVSEKRFYIEGDFIAHFDKWRKGGFQSYAYRTVYGVRKKLEVGLNFFYTRNGLASPKELQPNLKYRVFSKEKYGLAVSAGAQFFVPLNKAAGRRTFGMIYTNASKIVKQTGKTRLTGGLYGVLGVNRSFGTKKGAFFGVEQPIKGSLTFAADWYSGKNRFGYASAGLSYSFARRQILMVGYNLGNSGRGNNSFFTFYGFTY